MRTGVSTASLFLRENNETALPLLRSLGVKNVEVFLTSFTEYIPSFSKLLKEVGKGLDVNSIHVLNTQYEPQLFNAHPRVRADAYFWLDNVLQSANILGAKYYTFHGLARVKRDARTGENDNFDFIIKGLREISATCEKYGVHLALENVEWSLYNRVGLFSRVKKEVSALSAVLDIKQARVSEYPYEDYIKEMGDRLAYVHVSDVDERGKICLPGKGVFDFDTFVKHLKDVGFDGALLIEVYTGDYDKATELKTACEYLDEILYKNNCL